jgi:hypothetical protein
MMQTETDTSAWRQLRRLAIVAGLGSAIAFIAVGLATKLQMFGDGSIFSYAVAAQDAWAFHWHNISGRLFVYLYAYVPAQAVVALTGSASAGIAVYGLLFFAAPLLGLLLTFATDRSKGRLLFVYACFSTACLCPLVYGAPTEMWMAHALFWPALALTLYAPPGARGHAAVVAALLALVFTHEGAVVFAAVILFAAFLRGWRQETFARAATCLIVAMAVWLAVKLTLPPDDYIAGVMAAAAFKFIDIANLTEPAFVLLAVAIAIDDLLTILFRRVAPRKAYVLSLIICLLLLMAYWFWFDKALLAEARYNLRTVLLMLTPAFGIAAAIHAMDEDARRQAPLPFLSSLAGAVERACNPRLIAGTFVLTLLIHTVETTKFVWGWTQYKAAIASLAAGTASDPALGDAVFVSSKRIEPSLNRLSWHSTTPYLSVLVAPGMKPARLVVDPGTGYFWLSCETAKQSEQRSTALPPESRSLIRTYSCLHR